MSLEPEKTNVPPLPPRATSPPPSTATDHSQHQVYSQPWNSRDPRSSSTQSLVPTESSRDGRRLLMLIYIHGFMGNDTSFRSFPAHVHNLLTITLAQTHIIHTKIYPRYKSRKVIEFARDDFSKWLSPHESSLTDIVLLGHSMGGLLSAEVVLLPPENPGHQNAFRHKILGTVNFDTPFLGLHPGVIMSGLGSLFRPGSASPKQTDGQSTESLLSPSAVPPDRSGLLDQSQASSPYQSPALSKVSSSYSGSVETVLSPTLSASTLPPGPPLTDPNFNPPFPNDVRIPIRNVWSNALHFMNKHSDGITKATKQLFTSHMEFGGCMADYTGLEARYYRIRPLEDLQDPKDEVQVKGERRVRFVNYYSASTGKPKKPKVPKDETVKAENDAENQSQRLRSQSGSSRISVEGHQDDGTVLVRDTDDNDSISRATLESDRVSDLNPQLDMLEAAPSSIHEDEEPKCLSEPENVERISSTSVLPPLPILIDKPSTFDPSAYPEKDTRKLAEKDHAALVKLYRQAVKDRDRAIKGREKLLEKREKKARQAREKTTKDEEKQRTAEEKAQQKLQSMLESASETRRDDKEASIDGDEKVKEEDKVKGGDEVKKGGKVQGGDKVKKDKKFCVTPSKVDGKPDPTWIRVYMKDVDEIGAHCGLFFMGEAYESLVGDVGSRIEEWVNEAQSTRVVRQISNKIP